MKQLQRDARDARAGGRGRRPFAGRSCFSTLCQLLVLFLIGGSAFGQWIPIDHLTIREEETELGGRCLVIRYDLEEPEISPELPAYVFLRYRPSREDSWRLAPREQLKGNGIDLVSRGGSREIRWWGFSETGMTAPSASLLKVRALRMATIPAGRFLMKSMPGQGRDESQPREPATYLDEYSIARTETTISMYADYLNELGPEGLGWNERMAHPRRCGLERREDGSFAALPGREDHPITYVSWYDAVAFLNWCGLRLPSEAEFEKAIRGGEYLDGDQTARVANPIPERRFPWGDEAPDAEGVYRCNVEGAADGYEFTAPVGSFSEFDSPYGVSDLAGNVAEWTLDWYTTTHHAGLDGFRLVRGGSWMDLPNGVDAISGATQFPAKESSINGFRGVRP